MPNFFIIESDPNYQPSPAELQATTTKTRDVVNSPGFRLIGAVAPECKCTGLGRVMRFPRDGAFMAVNQRNKGDRAAYTVKDGKARLATEAEALAAGFALIPQANFGKAPKPTPQA